MRFLNRIDFLGFPRISMIFLVMIIVVIFSAGVNYYYISKEKENLEIINKHINPFIEHLEELQLVVIESKMYSTNWVYLQAAEQDRRRLVRLLTEDYFEVKKTLTTDLQLLQNHYKELSQDSLLMIFNDCETMFHDQRSIMKKLISFSDYNNPNKLFECGELLENEILPRANLIEATLNRFIKRNRQVFSGYVNTIEEDSKNFTRILLVLSSFMVLFILVSVYFIFINIKRPVSALKKIIETMSSGELVRQEISAENTVVGEMVKSINNLSSSLNKTAAFANEIELGNLGAEYNMLSDKDQLGIALVSMQNSLRQYSTHLESQIKERTSEVLEKSVKIEEIKSFYESILSNIPLDIMIMNEHRKYLFVNAVAEQDEDLRSEMLGRDDFELSLIHNRDDNAALMRSTYFNQAILTGSAVDYEVQDKDHDGQEQWKFHRFYPVNIGGRFNYMIDYAVDITGKKQQELKIKDSLEEKEALLGEIHHRVKNNLTLVLGLIEMQMDRQQDELSKGQFNEIKNRIYAMSLIHDKMYRSSSFANIDMKDYLVDLVNSISRFYIKTNKVNVQFDIDAISVKNKDAVPIALLVNEIVTNAFKYAFHVNKNQGVLKVAFKKTEEGYSLKIKDNGSGMPPDFDVNKSKSLGFKLIKIFVKQLKGELNYFNEDGFNFDIRFSI